MPRQVYRYRFVRSVRFRDVLTTLGVAVIAAESLHGAARTKLDVRFGDEPSKGTIAIDASTPIGRAVNALFVGFARREFGESAFTVQRMTTPLKRNTR